MKILSTIPDDRINAANVLIELTIGEYLTVAGSIIDNNEYQRKRVIKSKVKEILREDLIKGCSIPPIVLSITNDVLPTEFDYKKDIDDKIIVDSFDEKECKLQIIDGLQRTYVMLALKEELSEEKILSDFLNRKIRAEIYVGLKRLGLLYRMITLNTGQTTMSTRHLMEILYLDYQKIGIDGIRLIPDKNDEVVSADINEYKFKDVLDGFNSYIEKNERIVDRTEILDNIKTLNILKSEYEEDEKIDLFRVFVKTFKAFLLQMIEKSKEWQFLSEDFNVSELRLKSEPWGRNTIEIFKKSQVLTGFGAALGFLRTKRNLELNSLSDIMAKIKTEDEDLQSSLKMIVKHLDSIKEQSKKIGNDQRFYFKNLFMALFDESNSAHLLLDKAAEYAYTETIDNINYKK